MSDTEVTDKVIECPCGVVLTSDTMGSVVKLAQAHAREVHQMVLSDSEARSMARPA